jgi:hypothetical protein
MERHLATAGAVIAVLTAIVGTTIAIETRYAKSAEVKGATRGLLRQAA